MPLVGTLEERIFASLIALRAEEPDAERHMFVLQVSPLALEASFERADVRTVRRDVATMVCR